MGATVNMRQMFTEKGAVRIITSTSLVDSIGNGVFVTINAVYLVEVVGLSAAKIGIGLSIAGFMAFMATLPMGALSERFNLAGVLAVIFAIEALFYFGYAFIQSYWTFLILASSILICEKSSGPLRRALSAESLGVGRGAAIQPYLRSITNGGIAFGSLMAAVALSLASPFIYRTALVVDGATFIFAAAATARLTGVVRERRTASNPDNAFAVIADRPFLIMSVISGLLSVNDIILEVGIPLYLVRRTHAPHSTLTAIFVASTTVIVLLQIRFAHGTQGVQGAVRAHRLSAVAMCAGMIPLYLSQIAPPMGQSILLLLAGIIFTAGSLWQTAGAWGVSYGLAPEGKQATYQAAFTMGRTLAQIIIPSAIALLVVDGGAPGIIEFSAIALCLGFAFNPVARLAERSSKRHQKHLNFQPELGSDAGDP